MLVIPHDRVIVVLWSLNDICGKRGKWAYKMEHLADDVANLARLAAFAGPVIFVIGGSARNWRLPSAFNVARDEIINILRHHGCTAFTSEDMFAELAMHRHIDPKGYTDYWHFKESVSTVPTYDLWLERKSDLCVLFGLPSGLLPHLSPHHTANIFVAHHYSQ